MREGLRERLEALEQRLGALGRGLRIEEQRAELQRLERQMAAPDFWSRPEQAQAVVQQASRLKAATRDVVRLQAALADQRVLLELAEEEEDPAAFAEVERELAALEPQLGALELRARLSGPHDAANCYLTVHAGAGGTESCDWAAMLLRMYTRWADAHRMKHELVDVLPGEEAGVRYATVHIVGQYAYGLLRGELGVHRLVRISPFDAQARRHTSFAAVDVMPEIEDDIEIEIAESDLRIDTYRAGGAGGQHVNKTSSAVRITHLPTGIVVQCQNERSQHQNRRMAMQMLRAKLYQREAAKREEELKNAYDAKGEIAWGSQIRSYVLQPYTLVKDHRTGVETGNAQAVLDGEIDRFIEGYLAWKLEQEGARAS
ncbi:MAG: peptide chain release factor 2 [Planctomycetota bacterium]|nr:MAG: peptide chain release factor 2 [Planctomycetota bacterium]